jgi:hypothetical protein
MKDNAPQKPTLALLDTSDMSAQFFNTIEEMRTARDALVLGGRHCVSFLWEDGNYWIDGMSGQQLKRVVDALGHPEGLRGVAIKGPKP